ncbi:MAG: ADP-ribosylglycohydrolase family protein [Fermentimonas sp.]
MQQRTLFFLLSAFILLSCQKGNTPATEYTISQAELLDKIKGGWAGQVIGCTYGGPTEFKWNGTMIGDEVPILWDDTRMLWYYENTPGLYDDVYMDLTFVQVFDTHGLDAPDSLHAKYFANAGYPLWHANQAARYNILNGIMPPESGHWKNNPHADDIDFQIEADFAGLMSPGMVNAASEIAWKIGHIMNYGDGVYGGIYVAAMYALAFVHDDIEFIVEEALKSIPKQSNYYQCIADVIRCYREDPNDWKKAWFEAQKKWTADIGCPDGVFVPFNIDATINGAYIVIGLLYGKGDYGATIDISTRCGYDSDCNPANAGGILGTMIGYDKIPAYWKQGLEKVEHLNFAHTEMSLNKVYETGFRHASEMIAQNGGQLNGDTFTIKYQEPTPVPYEKSFEGLYPVERRRIGGHLNNNSEISFNIQGSGFVLGGKTIKNSELPDAVLEIEVYINNELHEVAKLPTNSRMRRLDLTWNYDLTEGENSVTLKTKSIPDGYWVEPFDVIVYSRKKPGKVVYF